MKRLILTETEPRRLSEYCPGNGFRHLTAPLPGMSSPWGRWVLRITWLLFGGLVTVENEHLAAPPSMSCIFVLNHNNSPETVLTGACLTLLREGRAPGFIIDWMFGRIPLLGAIFQLSDPVYVYNKRARYLWLDRLRKGVEKNRVTDACLVRLQNGQSISLFPEGSRNRDPHVLKKARKGAGLLALLSGRPVQPIGIIFPRQFTRSRIPSLGAFTLRFGPLLHFPDEIRAFHQIRKMLNPNDRVFIKMKLYLAERITHTLMDHISKLCGKAHPYPSPAPPPEWSALCLPPLSAPGSFHKIFPTPVNSSN